MLYYDNTILKAYNECQAKFYWRYILDLVPVDSNPIALEFGSAIHLALEYLYKEVMEGSNGSVLEAMDIFESHFSVYEGQDSKRTVRLGKDIIKAYHKLYFPEYFKVLMVEKSILVEVEKDVIFVGKVDLVVEMDDGVYVKDHKTSSSVGSVIDKPNHQFTGYVWGAKEQHGLDVKGAIINILGVFKTKRDFVRKITRRSEYDIELWKRWFLATVKNIKASIKEVEQKSCDPMLVFHKQTGNCYNYFRPCAYRDLCNCSDFSMRERLIEGMFKKEEWRPWEH